MEAPAAPRHHSFDALRAAMMLLGLVLHWFYLVHLPLTIWIPGLLAHSPLPAGAKFAIVLVLTTLVTTVTYHYLVRATRVGVLLNGRRYARGLPDVEVARTPTAGV